MSQRKVINLMREEARKNKARSRALMKTAREQDLPEEYIRYRTMAMERRDFADELNAMADVYSWRPDPSWRRGK